MTTASAVPADQREPELAGQIVVVIGGSAGIGSKQAAGPAPRAPASS
jgi:hypothetical protein